MNRSVVSALLVCWPLLAQSPAVDHCLELKHHGDPQTRACFAKLSQSSDLSTRAEGLWGMGDYFNANANPCIDGILRHSQFFR